MRRATKLQVRRNEGVSSTLVENLWETNVVDFLDDGDFDQLVSEEQNITTQAVLGTEIPTQESQVHIRTEQRKNKVPGPSMFNQLQQGMLGNQLKQSKPTVWFKPPQPGVHNRAPHTSSSNSGPIMFEGGRNI
ncbi:hypothetical protein ACS0TY_016022 [Phlomoides rotata]